METKFLEVPKELRTNMNYIECMEKAYNDVVNFFLLNKRTDNIYDTIEFVPYWRNFINQPFKEEMIKYYFDCEFQNDYDTYNFGDQLVSFDSQMCFINVHPMPENECYKYPRPETLGDFIFYALKSKIKLEWREH